MYSLNTSSDLSPYATTRLLRQPVESTLNTESCLTRLAPMEVRQMLQSRAHSELLKERTGHRLMLVAHRGTGPTSVFGSTFPDRLQPENSLQAIKAAILQGADAIEIDIFKSRDGKVMVTHDDEIWRNAYNADRNGSRLPASETKATYLVGQKTADELRHIPIGPHGETTPMLSEVIALVNDANQTLTRYGKHPIILNIELKDATAVSSMLDLVAEGKGQTDKLTPENIIFCSFKHKALKELKTEAERRGLSGINIAPGIKTADLFGKQNMKEDFSLKDPNATYQNNAMDNLRALVEGNGFQGYDGILWDLRTPIVDLAASGNKAIHASTSDFRQYSDNRDFSLVLLELSKRVETFFKCDNVDDARKVLLESSILLKGVGIQMMHKTLPDGSDSFYLYRPCDEQDNSEILKTGARKAIAYSRLVSA
ncbi:glycerophosphoryl diester phosphodiesterase [Pseudomonas mucidolens]|uniref:Glycerophosphoryl diester phosphodiesterase n=1 Tax=Pseudomonas mucidolens TaxID=46679 RepID=A0A1H2LXZ8_9PSED|nr:glycerophosphoryl diester phosphodiesterase [Pseudomonas mucidolens]SQH35008.1 glycerophosphodiester phosphodiesterase [Pseudomonas mucidolens]